MSQTPYRWRDHFEISDAFGTHKQAIEKALDDIAATGEDGEQLLSRAFHNQSQILGNTNKIVFSPPPASQYGSGANPFTLDPQNKIYLNIDEIRTVHQADASPVHTSGSLLTLSDGQPVRVGEPTTQKFSLTGTIVHELFHVADPIFYATNKKYLDSSLASAELKPQEAMALRKAVSDWVYNQLPDTIKELPDGEEKMQQITKNEFAILEKGQKHLEEIHDEIAKTTGIAKDRFSLDVIFVTKKPTLSVEEYQKMRGHFEEDAIAYTNQFMAKHFPDEPFRYKELPVYAPPAFVLGEPPRGKPRGLTSGFARVQAALAPYLLVPVFRCNCVSQTHLIQP